MNPLAMLTLNATALKLSEPLTATLTITGLGPLVVPGPSLTVESSRAWQIQAAGPPTIEKLFDGEERWTQVYKLDPYALGENVPVDLAPLTVTSGGQMFVLTVPGQTVAVTVTTQGEASTMLRPAAGPEPLPQLPPAAGVSFAFVYLALAAVVIAAATMRAWRRRPVPSPSPVESLLGELNQLQLSRPNTADELARLARRAGGLALGRDITTVPASALPSSTPGMAWQRVLLELDKLRFAGRTLSATDAEVFRVILEQDLKTSLPKPV